MKLSLEKIRNNHNKLFQYFLVILFSVIIAILTPLNSSFNYNIEKGSFWSGDDLYAENSFSIIKPKIKKKLKRKK